MILSLKPKETHLRMVFLITLSLWLVLLFYLEFKNGYHSKLLWLRVQYRDAIIIRVLPLQGINIK